MPSTVIIGCGYVGERVARAARDDGNSVTAVSRSSERAASLQRAGIAHRRGDLDQPLSLEPLPLSGALVYYFAPPPASGDRDPRLTGFLDVADRVGLPAAVVLISTTGVYGDCAGQWVDESRQPAPQATRARRRWDAEQRLQAWADAHGVRAVILRVAGIYGPGRLPRARLQRGDPVLAAELSPWSNRVHVDDLARACIAAGNQDDASGVYNIADGNPSTMTDYFNQVADAVGLPRPPQLDGAAAESALSEGMRSYLAESKRIDIRRMREELGIEPRYPNLVAGLAASLRAESIEVP